MKKKLFCLVFSLFVFTAFAQKAEFPTAPLKDLKGKTVDLRELSTDDKPMVIAFWATWCGPCIQELNAINDQMDDWQSETPFDFYAVSLDDSKTVGRVNPMVNGKGWGFNILLDTNNDLKRLLNISSPPYVVIVKNKEIVYRHVGYQPGSEVELYEQIKEFSK